MPDQTHPGDQPGVTVQGMEILAAGACRDGHVLTTADLDSVAQASTRVGFSPPLRLSAGHDARLQPEGHPAFGWLVNVRRVGSRLLADAINVPQKLAQLISRGAYSRIATDIFHDYVNTTGRWPLVLKAVTLHGTDLPRIDTLHDLEKLYHHRTEGDGQTYRTYSGRLLRSQDVDDLAFDEHTPGADVRQQEDPTMPVNYEDLSAEDQCYLTRQVVDHQVRSYMRAHAGVGYAEALAATLHADPHLKQRYATSWIPLPAGDSPSAEWHEAGQEILRAADAYQQEHPELSRTEAIYAVFRGKDHAALIRRYLRGSSPPST